jgi:hypothetical protein
MNTASEAERNTSALIRWATRAIAKPQENGSLPAVKPATGGRISYALAQVLWEFLTANKLDSFLRANVYPIG